MARTSQLGRGLGCPAVDGDRGGVLHVEKGCMRSKRSKSANTHIIMIVRGAPCCQAASAVQVTHVSASLSALTHPATVLTEISLSRLTDCSMCCPRPARTAFPKRSVCMIRSPESATRVIDIANGREKSPAISRGLSLAGSARRVRASRARRHATRSGGSVAPGRRAGGVAGGSGGARGEGLVGEAAPCSRQTAPPPAP